MKGSGWVVLAMLSCFCSAIKKSPKDQASLGPPPGSDEAGLASLARVEDPQALVFTKTGHYLEPPGGLVAGGAAITMLGKEFDRSPLITYCVFGDPLTPGEAEAVPADVISDEKLTCVAPASPTGSAETVAVRLAFELGKLNLSPSTKLITTELRFKYYVAPTVRKLTPATGTMVGGERVVVSGMGFDALDTGKNCLHCPIRCKFGDTISQAAEVSDFGRQVVCIAPAAPQPGHVKFMIALNGQKFVTGTSAQPAKTFEYTSPSPPPPPEVIPVPSPKELLPSPSPRPSPTDTALPLPSPGKKVRPVFPFNGTADTHVANKSLAGSKRLYVVSTKMLIVGSTLKINPQGDTEEETVIQAIIPRDTPAATPTASPVVVESLNMSHAHLTTQLAAISAISAISAGDVASDVVLLETDLQFIHVRGEPIVQTAIATADMEVERAPMISPAILMLLVFIGLQLCFGLCLLAAFLVNRKSGRTGLSALPMYDNLHKNRWTIAP